VIEIPNIPIPKVARGRARRSARAARLSVDRRARSDAPCPESAFTLTELLVVLAILTLLAATQLPALTGGKMPVNLTQCLNNLRQIGQASMVYKDDNADVYVFGNRVRGPGTGPGSVIDPSGWPMLLRRYLGGHGTTNQPSAYLCPSERMIAANWVFQVHFQANRHLLSDLDDRDSGIPSSTVRRPSIYWMFIEKEASAFCNIRSGALENPVLIAWNISPGSPGYRRHNGGMSGAGADGHAEWLRMPLYQPGTPPPNNFVELGDCSDVPNPASFGVWTSNGPRVKLFTRRVTSSTVPF